MVRRLPCSTVVLVGLLLAACGGGTTATATVRGTVVTAGTSTPVPGVTVRCDGQSHTTLRDGQFSLASVRVGSQLLEAFRSDYGSYHATVDVVSPLTVHDVQLEPYPVWQLSEGSYRVVFGQGYPATDEARLLAVAARLDRAANQVTLAFPDGSQQVLAISFRPRSQWLGGCATMVSHSLMEVGDLSPAPLHLESWTLPTPIVHAMCYSSPPRMILRNSLDEAAFLALDQY